MKTHKLWALFSNDTMVYELSYTKKSVIKFAEWNYKQKWKKLKKQGWNVRKVIVIEQEAE